MKELVREKYLEQIRPFYHDSGMIKVLMGVRRCGKSVLMRQISNELLSQGISHDNIVYLDLDDPVYEDITTANKLNALINGSFPNANGQRYLFIDEVQNVKNFEKTINGYRNIGISTFITGSNSYLLTGELATKLTGRYLEFKIYPFSFREVEDYRALNGIGTDVGRDFDEYLAFGGLPKRFDYPGEEKQKKYADSVIDEAVTKDIVRRKNVRNRNLFKKIVRFVSSIPSGTVSSTSIAKFLKEESVDIKPSTVNRYLDLIYASHMAYKCERYDVVGKKALRTLYKSYLVDPAMHTLFSGKREKLDYGMLIENVVYLELVSRGYEVFAGKKGPYEIDFVVFDGFKKAYVQVAYSIMDIDVCNREDRPLLLLKDEYPKYVVTMDPITINHKGLRVLRLVDDFLLGDKFEL